MNKHKDMIIKRIWTTEREFNKLINAINCNKKELLFEIILKIYKRGDFINKN